MATDDSQATLTRAVIRLLKPLVRILLRHGVPFAGFAELAKQTYVDVAYTDFGVKGRKQTNSRVSTITGLSRKEVQRLRDLPTEFGDGNIMQYNRAARVVYGWVHDENFQGQAGKCLDLDFETFTKLVKEYSGDIPPRAILDELLQVGVVSKLENETYRLLSRAYIPRAGKQEMLDYLGTDVGGLLETMDHNIHDPGDEPFFQRKVYYDNLPLEALPHIRNLIGEKAQPLLEEIDKNLALHDRDANPEVEGTGRKGAGIGVYYFETDEDEESKS